jgi:hypothetical protein
MRMAVLTPADARTLGRLARLPPSLTRTPRRRRVVLVAIASLAALTMAIGVAAHRPGGLASGLFLGCAVICARFITEPQFVRLEGLGLWPPPAIEPEPKA